MSSGQVTTLSSSDELESAIKKDPIVAVWVFDSDSENKSFGQKFKGWCAGETKEVIFYKAGTDDVKDAMKTHKLSPDNIAFFKSGELVKEEREDHNAVHKAAQSLI